MNELSADLADGVISSIVAVRALEADLHVSYFSSNLFSSFICSYNVHYLCHFSLYKNLNQAYFIVENITDLVL